MKIELFDPQAIYELGARPNQEDNIYPAMGQATSQSRVFLVCDGMGGCDKGEVASKIVCDAISAKVEEVLQADEPLTDDAFNEALTLAYNALDAADVKNEGVMGTTLTFLCFHRGGCLAAHIGDSRIYHLRLSLGPDMGMLYRSRDHSLVQQLYEMGQLSYRQMSTDSRKNVILKALQPHQPELTMAELTHITDIKAGDYFLMCSDGLLERMDDALMLSILGADCSDEEKTARLIEASRDNQDNHSAYLIRVKSVEREPGDKELPEDEFEARVRNKALNDPARKVVIPPPPFPDSNRRVPTQPSAHGGKPVANRQPATAAVSVERQPSQMGSKVVKVLLTVLVVVLLGVAGYLAYPRFVAPSQSEVMAPVADEKISMADAYRQLGAVDVTFDVVRQIEQDVNQDGTTEEAENYSNRLIAMKQIFLEGFMAKKHSVDTLINVYQLRAAYFSPEQREVMQWFLELPKHQQELWETSTDRVVSFQDFKQFMTNLIYY